MTSYTSSARYTLQVTGTNNNTWGAILNSGVFQLVDDNVNGRTAFALSGSKTLSSVNGATDEARSAILDITGGTGGTITIPSVSKLYYIRNGSSGVVVITTGAATTASIQSGERGLIMCDGSAVYRQNTTDLAGQRLTNVGDPVNPQDGATKNYADMLAFNANAGILPGQTGNSGNLLTTNGVTATWAPISGIASYVTDQAAKTSAATGVAIAFAIAL